MHPFKRTRDLQPAAQQQLFGNKYSLYPKPQEKRLVLAVFQFMKLITQGLKHLDHQASSVLAC